MREPKGLVLRVDGGGFWRLDEARGARDLIGKRVEVAGHRVGFNDIACDSVWPAGQPRPRSRRIGREILVTAAAGIIALGLIASIAGLFG